MPILTSKEKAKLCKKKLYKILDDEENHNGFQYKDGLNVDFKEFFPEGSCEAGGLYFSEVSDILIYAKYGPYIREVTVPPRVQIYADPKGHKYKAHALIMGPRRSWCDCIEDLIKEGADITVNDNIALRQAAFKNRADAVRVLLEHGANVHVCDDSPLRWAAEDGFVDVVKVLLAYGANVHVSDNQAMRNAVAHGHLDVVKVLWEYGARRPGPGDGAFEVAGAKGHTKVLDFLLSAQTDLTNA